MNRANKKKVSPLVPHPALLEEVDGAAEPPPAPVLAPEPPPLTPSPEEQVSDAVADEAAELARALREARKAQKHLETVKRRWGKAYKTYFKGGYSPQDDPSVVARVIRRLRAVDDAFDNARLDFEWRRSCYSKMKKAYTAKQRFAAEPDNVALALRYGDALEEWSAHLREHVESPPLGEFAEWRSKLSAFQLVATALGLSHAWGMMYASDL